MLSTTSKDAGFAGTFTEVSHPQTLGLRNDEQLRLFHLAVQNNRFNHADLVKLLRRNIGNYVFSRAEIERFRKDDEIELVALEAIERMKEQTDQSCLGEIVLYILLEQVLGAPKILSKVELNRLSGQTKSHSDSIHLFAPDSDIPARSIVFGTSSVVGDMQDAIDNSFERVVEIKKNHQVECQLAEQTVFTKTLDVSSAHMIKDLLIPQRGGLPSYDTSFALFLGYNLGLAPNNYSNNEYRNQLAWKMQEDIREHATYIAMKINNLQLGMHSFYVYVVPLDDVDTDAQTIVAGILGESGAPNV